MAGMRYIARREDGTEVKRGDIVRSFRGEDFTFLSIPPSGGGRRVSVEKNGRGYSEELYISVFKLTTELARV